MKKIVDKIGVLDTHCRITNSVLVKGRGMSGKPKYRVFKGDAVDDDYRVRVVSQTKHTPKGECSGDCDDCDECGCG